MFHKPSFLVNMFLLPALLMLGLVAFSQGWDWKNPLPQGNNTFGTWFTDANTGFLVGHFGTLMRTKDGGNTWEQYNLGTSAHLRTVNFADNLTGFVGGDYGKLFKTIDGGNNWFQLQISHSQDVFESIWFISPDTGYVISAYGKLFQTTDGGSTWTSSELSGRCIRFYDADNGIITDESCINRTTDGGITWNTVELNAPIYDCAYASSNIVLAGGEYMRRSVDGGTTWDTVTGAPRMIWTLHFTDELIGYAAGFLGKIYKTTDAGLTWSLQSQDYTESLFSIYFIGETGYIAGSGSFRPALYKTTNGGNDWQNLASGKGITYLTDLDIVDENTVYCVGWSRILQSTDQGNNWQIIDTTDGFHNAVDFPTSLTGYVGGPDLMLKTTDGGITWQMVSIPAGLWVSSICFINETTGIVVGSDGSIIRTTDGGNTWTTQYYNYVASFNQVIFVDSLTGFVAGGTWYDDVEYGDIMKTTDGGITWNDITVSHIINSVSFPSKTVGYAAGENILMKTINGGSDWTDMETNQYLFTNSLYFINADTGYSAGANGMVCKTLDGGLTWTEQWTKTGQDINAIKFIDDNTGFIAGDGCVLMKTIDGGGAPVAVKNIPLMTAKLNVFPNPVSEVITVESIPGSTLTIFNLTGKLMHSQRCDGRTTKLDFSGFPSGIYIIRQLGQASVATSKVIKR